MLKTEDEEEKKGRNELIVFFWLGKDERCEKHIPDGGDKAGSEGIVRESQKQTGLAHATVSDEEELDEIIIGRGLAAGRWRSDVGHFFLFFFFFLKKSRKEKRADSTR